MIIDDAKGRGYQASVNQSNRLNVSSETNPRAFYASLENGLSFILVSVDASSEAGDFICYIKNTSSTKNLFIKNIHYGSVNASLGKVWVVSGTASGTGITATNMNLSSGRAASISTYGNGAISGLTGSKLIDIVRCGANGYIHSTYEDALILGPNDAIAVEYDTGTTGACEVTVEMHFEDIDRKD